jgi:hypothetical protein
MTLDDCSLSDEDYEKKCKKDTRTMWEVCRQDGALMAVDFWCIRYINLPVSIRYTLLYHPLRWWGQSKLGRYLTTRVYRRRTNGV